MTFEQRPKESKWVSQESNQENNVSSQGNSWCQGPEVGTCLRHVKDQQGGQCGERVGGGPSNRLKSERLVGLYYIGSCGLLLRKKEAL